MPFLQDLLHKLEVGGGMRFLRVGLAVLAVVLLTVGYNWRAFRNMATQEAMDAAQLARNIAQGKGYTTLFIRPFSIYLVKKRNLEKQGAPEAGKVADLAQLRGMHPDLANPPVYPVVLAGADEGPALRLHHLDHQTVLEQRRAGSGASSPTSSSPCSTSSCFWRSSRWSSFWPGVLFDPAVAWLSAGLLLGSELFWRFSVSGLSTMLLMVIFLGLVWCVVLLEQEARAPKWGPCGIFILAGLAGAMVGLGGLTRYAFGWLIFPVLVFLILFGGRQRVVLALIALAAFAAVMAPWVARNYSVSGRPFGTATYAVVETTMLYPENRLERSLEPDFSRLYLMAFWVKLNTNLRQIITSELPKLGGSWITAFFLVGLLVGFRNPAITRLRYFLLGCVLVLAIAQALGRTQLSEESPEINSENLLVLLAPLVLVLWRQLVLSAARANPSAVPRIAVRRHRHLQPGRLPADGFCLSAPQDHSRRLSALLPAGDPDRRGLAERKGTGHERHPLGRWRGTASANASG